MQFYLQDKIPMYNSTVDGAAYSEISFTDLENKSSLN